MSDSPVPAPVRAALAIRPEVGQWYPVHSLITAGRSAPAVALLSNTELRAGADWIAAACYSSRAAANLVEHPWATLMVWANGMYDLTLELREGLVRDGVHGYLFSVRRTRTDDIGIPMKPLEYRVEEHLSRLERWDVSAAVLDAIEALA
jgi:hypothetical protein